MRLLTATLLAACPCHIGTAATHALPAVNDWNIATIQANRVFPGTRTWLLACSAGEGGHGGFVWNRQGSGAGGWMQFMRGTYDAYEARALGEVRRRGWTFPAASVGYYRPLGQALVAAYVRTLGQSHIHWAPSLDKGCW